MFVSLFVYLFLLCAVFLVLIHKCFSKGCLLVFWVFLWFKFFCSWNTQPYLKKKKSSLAIFMLSYFYFIFSINLYIFTLQKSVLELFSSYLKKLWHFSPQACFAMFYIGNHPKTQWPKTITIYFCSWFYISARCFFLSQLAHSSNIQLGADCVGDCFSFL